MLATLPPHNTDPLTTEVVKSLLSHHSATVNTVNAREIARERDITVVDAKNDGKDEYQCRITVDVETTKMQRSIAGTLIAKKPRVIDVKGISLESELGEHMLYFTNDDTPGVIGAIGTAAGDKGINIANLHLGRHSNQPSAIALLEVDGVVSTEDLEALRVIPGINNVQYLNFPVQ